MGRDKAALPFGGKLLWEHRILTLQMAGAAELFISGPVDGVYAQSGYPIIPDPLPNCGPMGGLLAALRRATYGHLLLLAVDLPEMTAGHLLRLWTRCEPGKGAVFRGEAYEPLAAFYPREILTVAERRTKDGDYSFQSLISEAQSLGLMVAVPVTPSDALLFRNWNAP